MQKYDIIANLHNTHTHTHTHTQSPKQKTQQIIKHSHTTKTRFRKKQTITQNINTNPMKSFSLLNTIPTQTQPFNTPFSFFAHFVTPNHTIQTISSLAPNYTPLSIQALWTKPVQAAALLHVDRRAMAVDGPTPTRSGHP